jgi:hypothetical protein
VYYGREWKDETAMLSTFATLPETLSSHSPVRFNGTATPAQVLAVMNDATSVMAKLSLGVNQPSIVQIAPSAFEYIANTFVDDDFTILGRFQSSMRRVVVESCQECEGYGPNGEDVLIVLTEHPGQGQLHRPYSKHIVIGI